MKKKTIYILSNDGVSLKKQRFFKTKISTLVFLISSLLFVLILFVNNKIKFIDTSFLGVISYQTENQFLRNELQSTNEKLISLTKEINNLAERDNEMRKIVNLPKIENQKEQFGFGGRVEIKREAIVSKDANELLKTSHLLIEQLENNINFQKTSYSKIHKKSEENKSFFASIPAIRPMAGSFALHGGFGMRLHPILGIRRHHEGIDIMNDVGTPVYATGDGIVNQSGSTGSAYGIAVEINHGYEYTSIYAHLSRTVVSSNQKIKRGQLIAYSGNTGLSSGPHLHYEVTFKNEKIDPRTFFLDGVNSFLKYSAK